MKITIVAGARPNFVKIAPIIAAIKQRAIDGFDINYRLVHTGQHYDTNMSASFFEELEIPQPHCNLGCAGGTTIQQIAAIMLKFEVELITNPTDLVLVVGDVNSTIACTLVAKQLRIKVAHIEAGIRSGDWNMPEEINRKVTDSITDYFFTTSLTASENLLKEGIANENIFFVGNTMIDTLIKNLDKLKRPLLYDTYKLESGNYIILTLHRPENVDDINKMKTILQYIIDNSNDLPIIFPVHPRIKDALEKLNLKASNFYVCNALGYHEFNYLVQQSKMVITDSGGVTEETTYLGIPCITLRNSTERPETCTIGTNELVGTNHLAIKNAMKRIMDNHWKKGNIPELWDGETAVRIIDAILKNI